MALADFAQRARTFLTEPTFANQAGMTPQDVERRKALAEALIGQSMSGQPVVSVADGLSRISDAIFGGLINRKAEGTAAAQQQAGYDALRGVAGQIGGPMQPIIEQLLGNPATADMAQQIIGAQIGQMMTPQGSADLMTVGADSAIYDPNTGQWITPPQQQDQGFRPLTDPNERAAYGIAPEDTTPYQVGPDNRLYNISGGGQTINVGGDTQAFQLAVDDLQQADAINANINNLQALSDLARATPTGFWQNATMGIRSALVSLGLITDPSVEQQQVLQAFSNQLALWFRNPDSGFGLTGNTSDRDVRFLQSIVPNVANQPEANAVVATILLANQRRTRDLAELRANYIFEHDGDLSGWTEYRNQWMEENSVFTPAEQAWFASLGDKYGRVGGGDAATQTTPTTVDAIQTGTQPAAPAVGTVEQGYRFLGGDPADPNNWQPVQ